MRLAATGLSNREIGEALFLSPRTVGTHLHHAFPKLGVTTRGQPARRRRRASASSRYFTKRDTKSSDTCATSRQPASMVSE